MPTPLQASTFLARFLPPLHTRCVRQTRSKATARCRGRDAGIAASGKVQAQGSTLACHKHMASPPPASSSPPTAVSALRTAVQRRSEVLAALSQHVAAASQVLPEEVLRAAAVSVASILKADQEGARAMAALLAGVGKGEDCVGDGGAEGSAGVAGGAAADDKSTDREYKQRINEAVAAATPQASPPVQSGAGKEEEVGDAAPGEGVEPKSALGGLIEPLGLVPRKPKEATPLQCGEPDPCVHSMTVLSTLSDAADGGVGTPAAVALQPLSQVVAAKGIMPVGLTAPAAGATCLTFSTMPSVVLPPEQSASQVCRVGPAWEALLVGGPRGQGTVNVLPAAPLCLVGGGAPTSTPFTFPPTLQLQVPCMGGGAAPAATTALAHTNEDIARAWGAVGASAGQLPPGVTPETLDNYTTSRLKPAQLRTGVLDALPAAQPLPASGVLASGGGLVLGGTDQGALLVWGVPGTFRVTEPGPSSGDAQVFTWGDPQSPLAPLEAAPGRAVPMEAPKTSGVSWVLEPPSDAGHYGPISAVVFLGALEFAFRSLQSSSAASRLAATSKPPLVAEAAPHQEAMPAGLLQQDMNEALLVKLYAYRRALLVATVGHDGWLLLWALHVNEDASARRMTCIAACAVGETLRRRGASAGAHVAITAGMADALHPLSSALVLGTSTGHMVKVDVLRGQVQQHSRVPPSMLADALPESQSLPEGSELVTGAVRCLCQHRTKGIIAAGYAGGVVAALANGSLQPLWCALAHTAWGEDGAAAGTVPRAPASGALTADEVWGGGVAGIGTDQDSEVMFSLGAVDGVLHLWDSKTGKLLQRESMVPPPLGDSAGVVLKGTLPPNVSKLPDSWFFTPCSEPESTPELPDSVPVALPTFSALACLPGSLRVSAADLAVGSEIEQKAGRGALPADAERRLAFKVTFAAAGQADGSLRLFKVAKPSPAARAGSRRARGKRGPLSAKAAWRKQKGAATAK